VEVVQPAAEKAPGPGAVQGAEKGAGSAAAKPGSAEAKTGE
jgi:hypothetical protein